MKKLKKIYSGTGMSNYDESYVNLVKQRRGNSLIVKRKLGEAVINKKCTGGNWELELQWLSLLELLQSLVAKVLLVKEKIFLPSDDDRSFTSLPRLQVNPFQLGSLLTECAWDHPFLIYWHHFNEVSLH